MRKEGCKPRSQETEESTIYLIYLLFFRWCLIQEATIITLGRAWMHAWEICDDKYASKGKDRGK